MSHPAMPDPTTGRRNLANAVAMEVANGYRVESQTEDTAIMVKGKGETNHILHLILTLLSCGLWGIVWIFMPIINKQSRLILRVDDYGNVLRQVA